MLQLLLGPSAARFAVLGVKSAGNEASRAREAGPTGTGEGLRAGQGAAGRRHTRSGKHVRGAVSEAQVEPVQGAAGRWHRAWGKGVSWQQHHHLVYVLS